jgi:hypothetical protein
MTTSEIENSVAKRRRMLSNAQQEYWKCFDQIEDGRPYFSYEQADIFETTELRLMDGKLIGGDFRELVNVFNAWLHRLNSWAVWNDVVSRFGEESDAWAIRYEFIEPLIHFCMHQPSGFRDRIIKFSTLAFHIGNLNLDSSYKDELFEDKKIANRIKQNHPRPYDYFLPRSEAESQLKRVSLNWNAASDVMECLSKLDDDEYRRKTSNWRNKSAHYIASHFEEGNTQFVQRYMHRSLEIITLEDGSIDIAPNSFNVAVAYGFGGSNPLSLRDTQLANKMQLEIAVETLNLCVSLLTEIREKYLSKNDHPNR